jgi:hypothetical protein
MTENQTRSMQRQQINENISTIGKKKRGNKSIFHQIA